MFEINILIQLLAAFVGVGIVGQGFKSGMLNTGYSRAFAGGSVSLVSANFLSGYAGVESFLRVCLNGGLGIPGQLLIIAISSLILAWAYNLWTFRRVVV